MSNNLVSVLIPAYNHEGYVQDTIKSIIAQTYENIELIIIDDGSKDSTWQKINELKTECDNRFAKFHLEKQENKGICATLNKLISYSSGKYIYIIASDDTAKPQAIEKEVAFLENNSDYVLAVGDNELINAKSERIGWNINQKSVDIKKANYQSFGEFLKKTRPDIDFNSDQFGEYETFVIGNYVPNGYLVRSSAVKSIGGYTTEAPLEDWYLHLQLSKIGKYKYIDEILFSYRWHDNNTIKRAEYMQNITYKTQLYEKKLVDRMEDKKWKEIFDCKIGRKKIKFKIASFLSLYSIKNIYEKKLVLSIFKKDFVLQFKKQQPSA